MAKTKPDKAPTKPQRPPTVKPNPGQPSERGSGTFGKQSEQRDR
jgi:hypothetical protein